MRKPIPLLLGGTAITIAQVLTTYWLVKKPTEAIRTTFSLQEQRLHFERLGGMTSQFGLASRSSTASQPLPQEQFRALISAMQREVAILLEASQDNELDLEGKYRRGLLDLKLILDDLHGFIMEPKSYDNFSQEVESHAKKLQDVYQKTKNAQALFVRYGTGSALGVAGRSTLTLFLLLQLVWVALLAGAILTLWRKNSVLPSPTSENDSTGDTEALVDKLQEQLNAKIEFIAAMSHELRTPLQGMLSSIDLMASRSTDERQKIVLKRIEDSAAQLEAQMRDFADFARLDAGKLELRPSLFNPFDVTQSVVDSLALQARERGIQFITDFEGNATDIYSDPHRFKQILSNLLVNAIKYADPGDVTIQLQLGISDDKGVLRFTVADCGPGINGEALGDIFKPFTQANGAAGKRRDGAGMGLAIVRRLIDLLNGTISVDSTLGKGTVFKITVPVTYHTSAALTLAGNSSQVGEGKHLLLVDDHNEITTAFRHLFEAQGYRCDTASTGQECIEWAKTRRYDVILLDIQMPGMDGITVGRLLRAMTGPNQKTPLIAVSARPQDQTGSDENLPFSMYLLKPVRQENLQKAVLETIKSRQAL